MNFKKLQKNKGMTYVELIVVLSIAGIIASISLFNYKDFQDRVDMKNLANDIALKIVEAQKSSIAGKIPLTGAPSSTWRYNFDISHENRKMHGTDKKYQGKKNKSNYDVDLKNPKSILYYDTGKRQLLLHPTQKPLPLIEWIVRTYSNENNTILDNTFGSCTTGIACINTNRNFIGIENNMNYFNISLKRVEEKRKEKDFKVVTSFGDGM
jgi:prepilin-type N-terminal cleavage/methylation domain-containing protein